MSGWGEARKVGKCPNCRSPWAPGEPIFNRGGVWLCAGCGTIAEADGEQVKVGGIEESAIKDLGKLPDEARDGAFASAILFMARQLDNGDVSPREVTMYTKEIRLNFMQLRDMFPPEGEGDETDKARDRRERRAREQGGY
jgi:hypothetical protein